MKNKQIVIIMVIVGALAGAGVLAYFSLGSKDTAITTATTNAAPAAIILPYGSDLSFDQINKFNQTGKSFDYPVTTAADTGLELNQIISQ